MVLHYLRIMEVVEKFDNNKIDFKQLQKYTKIRLIDFGSRNLVHCKFSCVYQIITVAKIEKCKMRYL